VSGLVEKATELTVISVVIIFLYNGYSWKGTASQPPPPVITTTYTKKHKKQVFFLSLGEVSGLVDEATKLQACMYERERGTIISSFLLFSARLFGFRRKSSRLKTR